MMGGGEETGDQGREKALSASCLPGLMPSRRLLVAARPVAGCWVVVALGRRGACRSAPAVCEKHKIKVLKAARPVAGRWVVVSPGRRVACRSAHKFDDKST